MQRIHVIKNLILEVTKFNDLVNLDSILNKPSCSEYETETTLQRAMQLYIEGATVYLSGSAVNFSK